MFRSLAWYSTAYFATLIGLLPNLKKAKKFQSEGKTEEQREIVYESLRKIANNFLKYSGSTVKVEGLENIPEGAALFICNHQSNFDIPVIGSYIERQKTFIAKQELQKLPLLSDWMIMGEAVFIDRDNARNSLAGILKGIELLKSGLSLVVFPEGTRSRSSKMNSFKAGTFKLATKAKVPIVPMTIDGTYKVMEANKNIIKPADITLYIHPPIYTDNLSKEELSNLHNTVEDIVRSKLPNQGR